MLSFHGKNGSLLVAIKDETVLLLLINRMTALIAFDYIVARNTLQ